MFPISQPLARSQSSSRARTAVLISLLATTTAMIAGFGSVAIASPNGHARSGILTGVIKRVGGIPCNPCSPAPGLVIVFKPSGRTVGKEDLHGFGRRGHHFRFMLPAGRYRLVVGRKRRPDCPVQRAVVHPHRTTYVILKTFCGVP